jgi:hypothetical protein
MKTPLVVVSISLTLAIVVLALFLIMTQTRRPPAPAIPSASHLKIEKVPHRAARSVANFGFERTLVNL